MPTLSRRPHTIRRGEFLFPKPQKHPQISPTGWRPLWFLRPRQYWVSTRTQLWSLWDTCCSDWIFCSALTTLHSWGTIRGLQHVWRCPAENSLHTKGLFISIRRADLAELLSAPVTLPCGGLSVPGEKGRLEKRDWQRSVSISLYAILQGIPDSPRMGGTAHRAPAPRPSPAADGEQRSFAYVFKHRKKKYPQQQPQHSQLVTHDLKIIQSATTGHLTQVLF